MNYRLRAYSLQDIGQRENQQDCFYPSFTEPCQFSEIDRDLVYYDGVPHTDERLFILCDGMGGHDYGEVASQIVTYEMSQYLQRLSNIEGEFDDSLIQSAVDEAHKALTKSKEGSNDMGTTMAVLKFHADGATIGHVGDSRVYQFRPASHTEPARVLFCTKDHHLADRPNILTRAIIAYDKKAPQAEIDHITDIKPGDIFMLCSDGIVEKLTDDELCALVTNPNYGDVERVQRLLLECKNHTDNHTATIIRIKDVLAPDYSLSADDDSPTASDSQLSTLPKGTVLESENYTYHIEKALGKGSFGITYLANINLAMKGQMGSIHTAINVCLKEFAMERNMKRTGSELQIISDRENVLYYKGKFRSEATKLALLSHPNIVRILEVFEANGTIYYSMEYLPEGNLGDLTRMRGGLPEKKAITYIRQVGSALSFIHANKMLHLDIKPDNVMRQGEGTAKIIDFGIARNYNNGGDAMSDDNANIGTTGFAPLEQVDKNSRLDFSPATDVYALGASYYQLLVAYAPNDAHDVARNGLNLQPLQAKKVSKKSIEAIKAAMQPDASQRLQTVDDFLAMLPSVDREEDFAVEQIKSSFPWKIILAVLTLFALFVLIKLLTK